MSQTRHADHNVQTCLKVFPLLAVLILVTVAVHLAHLPYKIQIAIELVKVVIVVGYFIHLIANRVQINNVWILTIIVVSGLLILPIFNVGNHLHGTVDTSKQFQAEQLAQPPAAEEEHNVH